MGRIHQELNERVLNPFDQGEDYDRLETQILKSTLGLEEESLKVIRIFNINAVNVTGGDFFLDAFALHENLSRINHSCAQNCVWSWKKEDVYVKEIHAVRIIRGGNCCLLLCGR